MSTAAETLTALCKNNVVPSYQEYLLQGGVLDSSRDVLEQRLQGLCDSVETGTEVFRDHELVYSIRAVSANAPPIVFRVRHSLDHPDIPWHLRYIGNADADRSYQTIVRNYLDCGISNNVVEFLTEMGFRLDHEFVVKGTLYRKGRMKVIVSKVFRVMHAGNTENIEPITGSCLVELSVVAPSGQDQIQEDMKNFAEQLKPLVVLEKIDHRKVTGL